MVNISDCSVENVPMKHLKLFVNAENVQLQHLNFFVNTQKVSEFQLELFEMLLNIEKVPEHICKIFQIKNF